MRSFPLISEDRINNRVETINGHIPGCKIQKELTDFTDRENRGKLDSFLAELENFEKVGVPKLKFKKNEITTFIKNLKRLLTSKVTSIETEVTVNCVSGEVIHEPKDCKPVEWSALCYISVKKLIEKKGELDKLFVCKRLGF